MTYRDFLRLRYGDVVLVTELIKVEYRTWNPRIGRGYPDMVALSRQLPIFKVLDVAPGTLGTVDSLVLSGVATRARIFLAPPRGIRSPLIAFLTWSEIDPKPPSKD